MFTSLISLYDGLADISAAGIATLQARKFRIRRPESFENTSFEISCFPVPLPGGNERYCSRFDGTDKWLPRLFGMYEEPKADYLVSPNCNHHVKTSS